MQTGTTTVKNNTITALINILHNILNVIKPLHINKLFII
ncbi:hypothetical protein EHF_0886 [Ehrlichia japonica]|uniref:Uncharacterized protein n=1 Tax=Ehrlichia japonica TaxID=391036 RepID=X5H3L8_9RICK|nr:hypothetical protein EHF_0886 [Ehrlichia japonica]